MRQNQSLRKLFLPVLAWALLPVAGAHADTYTDAAQAACEHVKECAIEQMGDVPAEMRPMIEASLDNMCVNMQKPEDYDGFSKNHPLYEPAVDCMESISAMSCEEFSSGSQTPECQALDKASEKYR